MIDEGIGKAVATAISAAIIGGATALMTMGRRFVPREEIASRLNHIDKSLAEGRKIMDLQREQIQELKVTKEVTNLKLDNILEKVDTLNRTISRRPCMYGEEPCPVKKST